MDVKVKKDSSTKRTVTISADVEKLKDVKRRTLKRIGKDLTVKGFRKGKAPAKAVEKEVGENTLQSEVLEDAVNFLYLLAVNQEDLRPIDRPQIEVKKYVPYTELEFSAVIEVAPKPKLGDYKKIKKNHPKIEVSDKEIDEVINNLRNRAAQKKEVKRASKKGDEVVIDFQGYDKDGKPISGAKGTDYPLILGSGNFIPGFEENLLGLKSSDEKEFKIHFPEDYTVKSLAGSEASFKVTVKKVNEVMPPKADDKFASTVGPFKTLEDLRKDIRTQLSMQKMQEAVNKINDEILEELLKKSSVDAPQTLVDDQLKAIKEELHQNIAYRGLTPDVFYGQEGMTEEEYAKKKLEPQAKKRVQVGLMLAEIVALEKIDVSDEEVEARIQVLEKQYQDPAMLGQFTSDEGKRELKNRMLTEKAVNTLYKYATQEKK